MAVEAAPHILFVGGTSADFEPARRELTRSGHACSWARVDAARALSDALSTRRPDLIISDDAVPGFGGLEALSLSITVAPEVPFIMLTGSRGDETAVTYFDGGAWGVVSKDGIALLPCAVRDVAVRRRALSEAVAAREALRESEQRYRTLVNSGRALVWTAGLDKGRSDFNRPWLDFRGRTLDQEVGDGWTAGIHPADRRRCLDAYAACFDWREPFSLVYRLRRHDGEYRWIQEDGTPRHDASRAFLGYIGHCLDITERLRAEQERSTLHAAVAQAQKMEAIGRLAGGVSHDLNNLLTGILGYCELLLGSLPPELPDRADVVQIQTVAHRASTLTRQLLAFRRKQKLQDVPLNLTALVSDLRKPLRTMVREDIDLVFELAPDIGVVAGDPGEIEQAIYSLVTNAVDAMRDGGRLTIRTAWVTLDDGFVAAHPGVFTGEHASLSVADTGTGIEPDVLALMFEPFYSTKARGSGTGLGLSSVYGIVRRCEGCVSVESSVGRGSTFTMYFPVSAASAELPAPPRSLSAGGRPAAGTILIVEDDEDLRVLLRRLLEGQGYAVLEAVDGQEAVAHWKDSGRQIDLLLTDVVMPGRGGLQLVRLLRESRPGLRVLLMSGYTDPSLFRDLLLDDHTSFIQKPCFPLVLVEQIRRLLDSPPAIPARPPE